jgi:hypothetical protein
LLIDCNPPLFVTNRKTLSDLRIETMDRIAKGFCVCVPLGLLMVSAITTQVSALSAKLAIECRQMAIEAYPPKPIGSKTGDAAAERKFYENCVAKGGMVSNDEDKSYPSAPAPK